MGRILDSKMDTTKRVPIEFDLFVDEVELKLRQKKKIKRGQKGEIMKKIPQAIDIDEFVEELLK